MELEVMKLIEHLEDELENSFSIFFTSKAIVDKEELFETIKDIRLKMPEEIKEALKIASDRQRIISEAEREADSILKSAAEKVTSMVSEHEISRLAEEKARELLENAQSEARNMRMATKEYVTNTLNGVESTLNDVLVRIREDRNGF